MNIRIKPTCRYPGCENTSQSWGFCQGHYGAAKTAEKAKERIKFREKIVPYEREFVYIMGGVEFDALKIGRSRNPLQRVREAQTYLPFELGVLHAFAASPVEVMLTEWQTHWTLKELGFNIRGEWFDVTLKEAIAVVQKCAAMHGVLLLDPEEAARQASSSHITCEPGAHKKHRDFIANAVKMARTSRLLTKQWENGR